MEIQAMGAKPLTKYQHKLYFPTYGMESRISTSLNRRIGRFKPLGTWVQNTSDTFLGSCMISFVELQIYCRTTIPKVMVAFLFIDSFPTKFITDFIARLTYLIKNSLDLKSWKWFMHSPDDLIW